jgi:hypothetical protein
MDIQERPTVGFGSSKDFVQGSLGAYFDGQIRSFSAHVGLQPLYSKIMNICPDTYVVCRKVGKGQYILHSNRMNEITDIQEKQLKALRLSKCMRWLSQDGCRDQLLADHIFFLK